MENMTKLSKDFGISRQSLHIFKQKHELGEVKYSINVALSSFFHLKREMLQLKKADTIFKANKRKILSSMDRKTDADSLDEAFSIIESFVANSKEFLQ